MSYDARIRQMQDMGILTSDQAERLTQAAGPYRLSDAMGPARAQTEVESGRHCRGAGGGPRPAGGPAAGLRPCRPGAGCQPNPEPTRGDRTHEQIPEQRHFAAPYHRNSVSGRPDLGRLAAQQPDPKEEAVFASWAQVESNYQRRADLIPNILESVADYMKYERETVGAVVAGRGKATGGASPETLDELNGILKDIAAAQESSSEIIGGIEGAPDSDALLERLAQAQKVLGESMHRVVALSENYPELRSSDQVLTLQAELEGSENRINVARLRFNEAAFAFNAAIRRMPASIVASMGNFRCKAYFKADAGADKAIEVDLD